MSLHSTTTDIRDLSYDELVTFVEELGEKPFRATQVFDWVYKKGVRSFDEMSNLPALFREKLAASFRFRTPEIVEEEISRDGTRKVLFKLGDNEIVETVLIPSKSRATVCVSTQAGCKFGCRFCASGIGGWKRDLTTAEILLQVLYFHSRRGTARCAPTHIVFMGIGEPFDNYDNLMKAVRTINDDKGINIGARRITISTCGVIPKIKKLSDEGLQIELAVSLHGYNNASRDVLMPVNRKYPYNDLVTTIREYARRTKRQVTFEYILIKDVTCSEEAAQELGRSLAGINCKMNLIPYNPVSEFDHKTPSRDEMEQFKRRLKSHGIHATIRTPRGRDVGAACGQLRHKQTKI